MHIFLNQTKLVYYKIKIEYDLKMKTVCVGEYFEIFVTDSIH